MQEAISTRKKRFFFIAAAGILFTILQIGLQSRVNADSGNATIGDLVWSDLNGNGAPDVGEPGLEAVRIDLSEAGADGVFETQDDVVFDHQTTDSSGAYSFSSLSGGLYRVKVDVDTGPPGWISTVNAMQEVELLPGQNFATADFGLARPEAVTIAVNPAAVTTLAGNGLDATTDGVGAQASFRSMGGIAIVGSYAYVGTEGAVRKIEMVSGEVTTLAGHPTATGCVDSTDPTQVRFASISDVATDGTNLFIYDGCGTRRVSIATGGASTLSASRKGYLTYGPDGFLYIASGTVIYKMNSTTGSNSSFASVSHSAFAITSDNDYLWVLTRNGSNSETLRKVTLSNASVTSISPPNDYLHRTAIVSAGDHLYMTGHIYNATQGPFIRRYSKTDGSWTNVAGTNAVGDVDGIGTDAWLSEITGLGTDGTNIWIVDQGNRRLKRGAPSEPLPSIQSPSATTADEVDPAAVSTFAGNGSNANFDGVGTSAGFASMSGITFSNGYAYVGTSSSIRKIDLSSGEVTTLTGHPSQTGCVDSPDPNQARLTNARDLTTDGHYLYAYTDCGGIKRISLSSGALSTVTRDRSGYATFGPDQNLYVSDGSRIYRVDPVSGSSTSFALVTSRTAYAISSDDEYVWAIFRSGSNTEVLRRFSLADASSVEIQFPNQYPSEYALTSVGDYLYLVGHIYDSTNGTFVRRYTKATGIWADVAGTIAPGYADGTGTDAWFSQIKGIASDGTSIWVADSGNGRVRKLDDTVPLPSQLSQLATTTLDLTIPMVATFAGSGDDQNVDGTGLSASFKAMSNPVIVGGYAYVGTDTSIRKINLGTGEVSTLAGDPTTSGTVDSPDPSSVRFGGIEYLATDGYYLYVKSATSSVRRTSLASGATSTIMTVQCCVNRLTFAPDGYLYFTSSGSVRKLDRITGVWTNFASLTTAGYLAAITQGMSADADYLWVSTRLTVFDTSSPRIVRISLSNAEVTYFVQESSTVRFGDITSAGDYLYQAVGAPSSPLNARVIRKYRKDNATWVEIAGNLSAGYVDDVSLNARFSSISGLASDGHNLWIADSGNRRLRVSANLGIITAGGSSFGWDGYGGWAEDVNAPLGNFVNSNTDLEVQTPGPDLEVVRTYNSLDTRDGAFGRGWTFNYEITWQGVGESAIAILFPDGRREVHTRNPNGTYSPPAGYFSTLTPEGSGFTLRTKEGTTYGLRSDGKLGSITDDNGRTLDLAYDGNGNLTTVTDEASSRRLSFTWLNGHVSSLSTDSIAAHGGPLTWKYYYSGNKLLKACDPRDNSQGGSCITYTYTNQRLSLIAKPRGNTEVEISYLTDGKVDWRKDGSGNLTDVTYVSSGIVDVTDPRGNITRQEYDSKYRLVKETDPDGGVTSYTYDAKGNRNQITDPNGNVSSMTYDERGNLLTQTDPEGKTRYLTYDSSDNMISSRDPRSSSATDNSLLTTLEYDPSGNKTKETSPPTADFPSGVIKNWSYTAGSESAVGGGTMPSGLLRTETDAKGAVITYSYDSKGDLREVLDRVGLKTTFTYDEIGRKVTETQISDTFPSGVVTSYTYDVMGNVISEISAEVTNPLTLVSHRGKITKDYDANSNLVTETASDLVGGDIARVTTYTYDANDRQTTTRDPEGGIISRVFDATGNVSSVTDQEGRITLTTYNKRNLPVTVTAKDFVDDPIGGSTPRDLVLQVFGYDAAGRKISEVDALGRRKEITYDEVDRITETKLKSYENRDSTTRDIVLESNTYDAAGNLTRQVISGVARTDHAYDASGRITTSTFDPTGLNRVTSFNYDQNGNPVKRTVTDGTRTEEVRFAYDSGDRKTSETIENGSQDITTSYTYDKRGLVTSKVDPRGNVSGAVPADFTTQFEHDELGRLTKRILPEVMIETDGGSPTAAHPTSVIGYNTFSDVTHAKDERGQTTTKAYDKLARVIEISHPVYVNLDGVTTTATESYTYDGVGNMVSSTDRRGEVTDYTFDKLNRVVRQLDPLVTGESQRGAILYAYDDKGNRISLIDQTGAKTEWSYDDLDRSRTETKFVRKPSSPPDLFTTTFDYDDLGNQTYRSDPLGGVATAAYSTASERLTQVDELGKTTSYLYDLSSRATRETDPLGRYLEHVYDLAGRKTADKRYSATGALLTTTSFDYDQIGNETAVTTPRGYTTNLSYDALSRLTQIVEPVSSSSSITTSYGYDQGSNLTRATDGEGRSTILTYQAWGLTEKVIEPSTTSHPATSDRTWVNIYDAGGLLTEERQPGGVVVTRSFDELGRLVTESGSGGGAASALKSFTYDLAGSKTSLSHPTSAVNLQYDDRKLLTQSSGGAGTATYSYDCAGRLTAKTDQAGSHSYSWNARGDLTQVSDPLSAKTVQFTTDDARQVTEVSYGGGTSDPDRTYSYDDLGRLTADVLKNGSGVTQTSFAYSYDFDSNLTSQTVSLPVNLLSGAHTYTYDRAGRLATWTRPSLTGPATDSYGWDKAGNRIQAGGSTYTYDARNRLLSAVEPTGGILPTTITRAFTYTPRGTLSQITDGVTPENYSFDALGRLTGYSKGIDSVSYTYDGLDRIAQRSGTAFTYSGFEIDPTSEGNFTFSRSPAGRILSLKKGADVTLAGLNRHGDLSYLFDTSAQVSDTKIYDPFGKVASETGNTGVPVGFQGDFTDPASSKVWMGARWYGPNESQFLSRDTVFGALTTPITLNRYTYAQGDPLSFFDPDGRFSFNIGFTKSFRSLFSGRRNSSNVNEGMVSRMSAASQLHRTLDIQSGRGQFRSSQPRLGSSPSSKKRNYTPIEFVKDVGGVFKGVGEGVVDTVKGVARLGIGTAKFIYRGTVECARGRASCYEQAESIAQTASHVRRRKLGLLKDIASAVTSEIRADWKSGNQGEAIGRGIAVVGEALVGTKGLGKVAKLRKLEKLEDVSDVAKIGRVSRFSPAPKTTLTLGDEMGILREATRGKGNFGVGAATRAEAESLGRSWVSDGYRVASDGKTLISKDGLRQFRPPSFKPSLEKWQANLEQRWPGVTEWQSNAHLNILDP